MKSMNSQALSGRSILQMWKCMPFLATLYYGLDLVFSLFLLVNLLALPRCSPKSSAMVDTAVIEMVATAVLTKFLILDLLLVV